MPTRNSYTVTEYTQGREGGSHETELLRRLEPRQALSPTRCTERRTQQTQGQYWYKLENQGDANAAWSCTE